MPDAGGFERPAETAQIDAPERPLPYNAEIEQALLGALLLSNSALAVVRDTLHVEHFGHAVHARIYAAIIKLVDRGINASPVTLKNFFDADSALVGIGGGAYLTRLARAAVTIVNAPSYARMIVDLALRRFLMEAADSIHKRASAGDIDDPLSRQLDDAADALQGIHALGVGGKESGRSPRSAGAAAADAIQRSQEAFQGGGKLAGISSGIAALDRKIGGLIAGNFIIVGGRPSQGKSALATTVARTAARNGLHAGFWSLEMPDRVIANRLLAAETGISVQQQTRGNLTMTEWDTLIEAQREIEAWPLTIDGTPGISPGILCQRARHLHRRRPLALIIIDYLQLMGGEGGSDESRDTVPRASRAMRDLAKELDVPVVALSQVKREVDLRDDKRPHMADLLWSGALEADANTIAMVYRPEYYLAKSEPIRGTHEDDEKFSRRHADWSEALDNAHQRAELIIEKDRDGGDLGTLHVRFDGARSLFEDFNPYQERFL